MCFSAEVSFAAGVALLPVGAYCLHKALQNNKAYAPLAILPIAFGVQQLCEGFVWVGANGGDAALVTPASLAFLAFALVFWPFWIPLAASFLERRSAFRIAMRVLAAAGLAFGLFLYIPIAIDPGRWLTTRVQFHSIQYNFVVMPLIPIVPGAVWQMFYVLAVSVPLIISEKGRRIRTFGILVGVSAALSHFAFWYAFFSVWCLFAACLSVYLIFLFRNLPGVSPLPFEIANSHRRK